MNYMNESEPESSQVVDPLIAALRSKNATEREKARGQLIALGHGALIPLLHCLSDDEQHVRWEAAKALEGIADPAAADALAEALNDEIAGVRWIAGEALIAIGWEGVRQVLVVLLRKSDTTAICTSAHHVLSHFAKHRSGEFLKPVLERLEGVEPAVSVPIAALTALGHLRRSDLE
jgi:HEAT repeat protein